MTVSADSWENYIERLRAVSDEAARKFAEYYARVANPFSEEARKELSYYAFVLGRDYGEAAAELACEMYDSMVLAEGLEVGRPAGWIEPAVPAKTATYEEAARTVNGVLKESLNVDEMSGAVGRLVKTAGVDTILQNAYRDRPRKGGGIKHRHSGAQVAWIPHGDTCPFCIALASRGWQNQSVWAEGNHAEHVHNHCDCTYGVRFSDSTNYEGYDPEKYLEEYQTADPDGKPKDKINAMRREQYAQDKDKINAQKRAAYAERKERQKLVNNANSGGANGKVFTNGNDANKYFGERPAHRLRRENREEYNRQREQFEKSAFGKWYNTLSTEQTVSIAEYSGDSYSGINGLLRHEMTEKMVNQWDTVNNMPLDSMIKNIESAIDEFEIAEPIKVFRTCEKDVLENLRLEVGSTFHDNGFGSTSVISQKVASGNIVLEINVPSGKGYGAWINPLSGAQDEEYEFLLQRGSDYMVKNYRVSGDDTIVELNLLGNTKTDWSYASRDEVIELFKKRGVYDEGNAERI